MSYPIKKHKVLARGISPSLGNRRRSAFQDQGGRYQQTIAQGERIMNVRERSSQLISPYGGKLVDLMTAGDERHELLERAKGLSSVQISTRSVCDLELMAQGAFSP